MTKSIKAAADLLTARATQAAAIVFAFAIVAWMHAEADGLWFQGDAPRHAINGLFWWDLLGAMPVHPVDFAVRYYARYPVIAPATYPPLFYVLEGAAFALFGPSPYVARLLVLAFGIVAGLYTMAWSRRWIGAWAGWTGSLLAFTPAMVLWSNTVMLNVPAMALSLASLYHLRRWREGGGVAMLAAGVAFLGAALITYYPAAAVLPVAALCAFRHPRQGRSRWYVLLIAAAALATLVPLLAALAIAPVQAARFLPDLSQLERLTTWTYYWTILPTLAGAPVLASAIVGLAIAVASRRWRRDATVIAGGAFAFVLVLSLTPARDARYALLLVPALLIAAATGAAVVVESRFGRSAWIPAVSPAAVLLLFGGGMAYAARVDVPVRTGFREFEAYLRVHAPADPLLYDGQYDGVFGFYLRAADPSLTRRFVRADHSLYSYGPTTTFAWEATSQVRSPDDVIAALRHTIGCRWVAVEVPRPSRPIAGRRALDEALLRPEFEKVRTFPIAGTRNRRIELYRLTGEVQPVNSVDLAFPALTDRRFTRVAPITR